MNPLMRFGLVAVMGLAAAVPDLTFAQPRQISLCDIDNARPVGDPAIAYRRRGDRCEGVFAPTVSSSGNLRLLGFHQGRFQAVRFGRATPRVSVKVQGHGNGAPGEVLLRGSTLRPLTYYALDTYALGPSGEYSWSPEVLSAPSLALSANELAFTACTHRCRLSAGAAYLPVAMAAPGAASASGYTIVVQAQRELSSIEYEVSPAGGSALPRRNRSGPFPSRRSVALPLGDLEPGRYSIRIVAHSDGGQRSPLHVPIVIP